MPMLGSRAAGALKAFGQLVSSGVFIARDTLFKLNSLLLKGNSGDPTDQIKELPPPVSYDGSGNAVVVSMNGVARPNKFNPVSSFHYSTYFDGSSYVDFALGSTGACAFGTSDFTIEFWVYPLTTPNNNWSPFLTIGFSGGGQEIRISQNINGTGWGWLYPNSAGTADVYTGYGTLPINRWHHIAVVRSGSTMYLFLNGVNTATNTGVSFNFTNTTLFRTGYPQSAYPDGSYNGYMHGLKIVKGTALYTSAFTPSTTVATATTGTSFLSHNYPYWFDSANNLTSTISGTPKITQFIPVTLPTSFDFYGSTYLSGATPDSLSYPVSIGNFGANNFTIECWAYFTTNSIGYQMVLCNTGAADFQGWGLYTETNNILHFICTTSSGSWTNDVTTSVTPKINCWTHLAVVRNGATITLYVNGVSSGTTTIGSGTLITSPNSGYVGYYPYFPGGARSFTGYISNVRIVNSAVYTTNFTPSNSMLTAVPSTALLTCQYNGSTNNNGLTDRSNIAATITRNGNMTQGTFAPYNYNWSVYFNGTNTNLSVPFNSSFVLDGDFTFEFWFYPMSTNGGQIINFAGGLNIAWASYEIKWNGTSVNFAASSANTGYDIGSETGTTGKIGDVPNLNQWYHLAVTRTGNVYRGFLNGVQGYTQTLALTPYNPNARGFTIGSNYQTSWGVAGNIYDLFTGYISNVRIIKGQSLYTANFTPSVKPLLPSLNTTLLVANDGTLTDKSFNRYTVSMTNTPLISPFGPFSPSTVTQNQGYYSVLFSSSTLNISSSLLNFGSSTPFAIEWWMYPTDSTTNNQVIFAAGSGALAIMLLTGGNIQPGNYQTAGIINTSGLSYNTWTHVVVSRDASSNWRVFWNGVLKGYASYSFSPNNTSSTIGGPASNTYYAGYLSNFKITVGEIPTSYTTASTTVGTTVFTSPTDILTASSTTAFLSLQNTTITDVSSNKLNITNTNTAIKVIPFSPFSTQPLTATPGTIVSPYTSMGSYYVGSATDYAVIPHNLTYDLSTGTPWTFDAWIYTTGSSTAYRTIIAKRNAGTQWEFFVQLTTSYFGFYNGTQYVTNIVINNNMWYHVAAGYDGTNLRLFVNGVLGYTGAVNAVSGTDNIYIGAAYYSSASQESFVGYISDLRVIRGRNLYSTSFLPPTAPPAITPDTILMLRGDNAGIFDNTGDNNIRTINNARVSTTVKKFNTGSLQFVSSTSDYMLIPGNPIFNTGTQDWTVDCWVYLNSMPTSDAWPTNWSLHMVVIGTGTPGQGDGTDCIIGQTKLLIQVNDVQYASTSTHGMTTGVWYHLAYVRYSNTFMFYVNGVALGSVAIAIANGTGSNTYIGCETGEGAFFNGYIDDLRFSRYARYTSPYFPVPAASVQETGPTESDPGTSGLTLVSGDGLSSATAGISAVAIKAQTGTNVDGVYWINLPTVGPTQVYCIMNSAANGGGWMMAMKATRGTTFSWSSTHWNSVTTLNTTANNRADGDAKFNTMNYFAAKDIMALWPDITTNGGGLGTNPYSCWSWLENNFNGGSTTTLINFFNTAGTFNTGDVNTSGSYGGKFVGDAKLTPNWGSGVFSSQPDVRFYGFNFKNYPNSSYDNGNSKVRWGFGWNENGEGLASTPALQAAQTYSGSNDASGGIGMDVNRGSYSAGDQYSCCTDSTGINRSARVEIYIR